MSRKNEEFQDRVIEALSTFSFTSAEIAKQLGISEAVVRAKLRRDPLEELKEFLGR